MDSFSIKVFNTTNDGAAPVQSKVIKSDGSTSIYDIGQNILESKSVLVYLDGIQQQDGINYIVDIRNNQLEFVTLQMLIPPLKYYQ